MTASGKVLITSDFPTPDEVASALEIPAARVAELRRIVDEVREQHPRPPAKRRAPAKVAKKK